MATTTDTKILDRLLGGSAGDLNRAAAEGILSIRFPESEVARMNELAAKARDGSLTPEQSEEAQSYNRIGHLVALLHSKARRSLKAASDGARGG